MTLRSIPQRESEKAWLPDVLLEIVAKLTADELVEFRDKPTQRDTKRPLPPAKWRSLGSPHKPGDATKMTLKTIG